MAALNDPTTKVDIEKIAEWVSESKRKGVNIVVVGETGYGKSTLINGLVGKHVMETGRASSAVTKSVKKHEHREYLRIFDTPGFFAAKSDMSISDILQQIANETNGNIDLLVYCHDMQARITEQTARGIGCIADTLCTQKNTRTPSWRNVLFVLTRANQVENSIMDELETPDQPVDPSAVKTQFEELYRGLCKAILEVTEEVVRGKQLPCNAAEIKGIPVVAAGFRKAALPGCEDWLSHLWAVAYSRVNETACPAFLEATVLDRLQPPGVGPDLSKQLPSERKICNEELAAIRQRKIAGGIAVGALSVPVMAVLCAAGGAAVGAAVGTFGGPIGTAVGAAAGAKIGGAVGGAVGGVVGVVPAVAGFSYAAYKRFFSDSKKPKTKDTEKPKTKDTEKPKTE